MKILNPNDLPTLDYRTVKELQGDLKDLHTVEQEKLHRVLNDDGFDVPIFVWKNPKDSNYYLLDGHQRVRVMKLYDLNDAGNYEVPYIQFAAKDEQAAKAKLLKITSQFGRVTREGLDEFIAEAELPDYEDMDIQFDAISDFEPIPEPDDHEKPESKREASFTISELRVRAMDFELKTNQTDNGFVEYLASNP